MIPETLKRLAVPIDSVKPYGKNPRQGDVGAVMVSIEANGQYRPIVVNKRAGAELGDNTILAGKHTWQAMKQLDQPKVAVTFVDVDDETARRIVLVDNRTNDLASYDEQALADLLTAIAEEAGPDGLVGTGFDGDDVDDLLKLLDPNDDGGGETGPALGDVEYRLVILCDGETHQAELLERFQGEGLNVQALAQ